MSRLDPKNDFVFKQLLTRERVLLGDMLEGVLGRDIGVPTVVDAAIPGEQKDAKGIAFDVHAGGIVSGAVLALVAVRLGWRREAFMQDEPVHDDGNAAFHQAMLHLGKLEIGPARELLRPLIERATPPLPRLLAHAV